MAAEDERGLAEQVELDELVELSVLDWTDIYKAELVTGIEGEVLELEEAGGVLVNWVEGDEVNVAVEDGKLDIVKGRLFSCHCRWGRNCTGRCQTA